MRRKVKTKTRNMRLISKVYLPVIGTCFCGEAIEAAGILSVCVNVTVISFVMGYNNKTVGAIFGSHITF